MKRILFVITLFYALTANAQNYLISFAGSGASITVSTVKVENLTKGTTLTINGSDILRLTTTTGINSIEDNQSSELKIYPNPMTNNATLEIFPPIDGNAIISVYDMMGKLVAQIQSPLEKSKQEFRLSGLENGFYLISVKGRNYHFSGKLQCNGKSNGTISIEKVNNIIQIVDEKVEKNDAKGIQAIIDMDYSSGDRLKYTGISGSYSTVKIDIPTSSKTITFNFILCRDGSNISYPVVEIGTQVWMAENLKTTRYLNGDLIGTTTPSDLDISFEGTPSYQWAYGGNEGNVSLYGRLYTWYAANDTRILCPTGWHLPADFEWDPLMSYLGSSNVAGGKLKETSFSHWLNPNTGATNESGFTGVPAGGRFNDGTFGGIGTNNVLWLYTEYNTTDAYYRGLGNDINYVYSGQETKQDGLSIRCVLTNKGTVIDYEGNVYNTIQIGRQEWMTENLKSTKYRDGTSIPYKIDDNEWSSLITDAYCWYLNDPVSYKATYGALYNWYAVNTGKLCPTGWHVPIRADWLTLIDYLGGLDLAYDKLKSIYGWTGYQASNGNNNSGFAALPGGYRGFSGNSINMGTSGNWWSATSYDSDNVWYFFIFSGGSNFLDIETTNYKFFGYSVRCVKDN